MAGAAGVAGLLALAAGTLCLTSGCSSIGYLSQSVAGHLSVLNSARPVADWLNEPTTAEPVKAKLALTQRIRDFAVSELHLPDNRSYRSYADLHRTAAVWNVAAAPELSLKLQTWCYPVVGCVGYRGYYDEGAANAEGEALRAQGLEVTVYPVPAYSTLGKMEWLGGDPLLNTFIQWHEAELARLIFHELAHQVAYAEGDTAFNESFATAVERLGGDRWLDAHGSDAMRAQVRQVEQRRQGFRQLTQATRAALDALYRSELDESTKRERKAQLMAQMRADHARLKAEAWNGYAGYDAFFSNANNASLSMQGAYLDGVPAFVALFEREGRDFPRFYAAVQRLAALPRAERDAALHNLSPAAEAATSRPLGH
ncbi:aminopeptidase [Ideonella sp. DXS29W]|uniref:Aminopeptidase n=1 Tax=Ideonella lacteola TaxID=2984193 RepID=A0ABU9BNK7_9BURK